MNEKDAYALVDIFMKIGIHELDILGGEPMLVPWMKDFVKYATVWIRSLTARIILPAWVAVLPTATSFTAHLILQILDVRSNSYKSIYEVTGKNLNRL